MTMSDYHSTRLKEDTRRDVLWSVLGPYLQRHVLEDSAVLDFGAGYCGFINNIRASRKVAYDQWDGIRKHAHADVECKVGDYTILGELGERAFDVVFASNVFEHFAVAELERVLALFHRVLKPGGRIMSVQPNYYYAYRHYFDDYTHKSIWTHRSLPDFLKVCGFSVPLVVPAFMPLTLKSRLPVHPLLIRAYLASPIKPRAGQMLVIGRLDA